MKWRVVPEPPQDPTKWHRVFLWKPVQIGDYMHWLKLIYRRQLEDGTCEYDEGCYY